ncbi:MAG: hypothetical protein JF616_20315 [Fibrobacteres bacterium]|nr:hypothetical protein [Fibrobacterota bacterium]
MLEYGQTLYLANRSGLFAYHPFADTAGNLFCNAPGHYTGEIMRYGDSMVVSDSGYMYRISKLGENIWRPFPLPGTVGLTTCAQNIFSGYFVTKNQKKGCSVPDSIKIEIVDLKTRKSVSALDKADYQYPIDYRTYQNKLFVSLGREGGIMDIVSAEINAVAGIRII